MYWLLLFSLWFLPVWVVPNTASPKPPEQPEAGPGGAAYRHDSVRMSDFADEPYGFWLFEPMQPQPKRAPVVVFNHGYGALNPMVYGGWIRHLVRRGNVVVFPRYQKNMFRPWPKKFDLNIARGIHRARIEMTRPGRVQGDWGQMLMIGHSYGGAMSAYLAARYADHQIPKPRGIFLCAPGTGPLRGGRLKDYQGIPEDIAMLLIHNTEDKVVGDKFQYRIFQTAQPTACRNMLHQLPDDHGSPAISAGHNECYSLDEAFDSGWRNPTVLRAYRVGQTDALDYYGYWKLFDAMAACVRQGEHCDLAFGHTPQQLSLGEWSDGQPVRPFEPVQ